MGTGFLIVTFAVYNISIVAFSRLCLQSIDLRKTLKEKREAPPASAATAGAAQQSQEAAMPSGSNAAQAGDSYSRMTGAVGAVIIACFVWALGNALIYNAFESPSNIPAMLNGVGTFILSSSALFAPYAFNQLSSLFPIAISQRG